MKQVFDVNDVQEHAKTQLEASIKYISDAFEDQRSEYRELIKEREDFMRSIEDDLRKGKISKKNLKLARSRLDSEYEYVETHPEQYEITYMDDYED